MRALLVTSLEGPEAVTLGEAPELDEDSVRAQGSGVLIDVRAAGIGFPDVLMSRGQYQLKPELPFIPGIEVAGSVAATAPDSDFEVGDRVAAFTVLGGLAERVVASPVFTFAFPGELDWAEGASLVVNYHTAYLALVNRAGLAAGENVIVHGAGGGLGSAALQVAAGLGATTVGVVSSDEKERVAREAGADHVVRVEAPWREAALEVLGGRVADIVFDPVGGDRATESLRILREGGRLLVVGFTSGGIPEVKVNRLLLGNISVIGAGWGAYINAHPESARPISAAVNELVRTRYIRPLISNRFPLERATEALELIDRRQAVGKVVVEIGTR